MRKMLAIAALPLALALVSGSALAADLSTAPAPVAPPPVTAITFTGLYVGAVGSYGWGNTTAAFSAPGGITDWKAMNMGTSGWLLGATVGYNYQTSNNWVFGVEGDISGGNIGGSGFLAQNNLCFGAGCVPADTDGHFHQSYFGTLRARTGMVTGSPDAPTLWYITGGLAFSDGHREIQNVYVGDSLASATHTGWVVGIGAEHKFNRHWSVKGELLYADLGTQHYQSSTSSVVTDVHLTDTLLRVGLNYGF